MSYQALYRKFRPDTFEEVKGQDAIVTTLRNQVQTGRVGHAYLFCGTRGTGKTTVAKILAQAVNCEHPVNGEACHECPTCRAIESGSAINVIEIDAASNNGVDNIREIREEVAYSPTQGKYKVYIIDEVHMLSGGAFNALLKTLEEPPAYVIFILATTEARKIPATILSRCQRYDFRRISAETIENRLADLLQREGASAEPEALRYLARQADGSMRDSLSLLDQCLAFYPGEPLTYEHVLDILGAVDPSVFGAFFDGLIAGDVPQCLRILSEILDQGRDLSQFVSDFIWYLRNLLLVKSIDRLKDAEEVMNMALDNLELLKEKAEGTDASGLFRLIREFSKLSADLRLGEQKRLLVEVAIIRLCRPEMSTDTESLAERVRVLEGKVGASGDERSLALMQEEIRRDLDREVKKALSGIRPAVPQEEKKEPPKLPAAVPADVEAVIRDFRKVAAGMEGIWQANLKAARLSLSKSGNLLIVFPTEVSKLFFDRRKQDLELFLAEKTGKRIHLELDMLPQNRTFEELYVDLEKKVKMPIEIVDDEE